MARRWSSPRRIPAGPIRRISSPRRGSTRSRCGGREDGFVDELFAAAPALGAPLLAATFPRVFCDVNREPWELDPGMFDGPLPAWVNTASPRVGAGLGTIARVVASGEAVYRHKLHLRRGRGPHPPLLAALPRGARPR